MNFGALRDKASGAAARAARPATLLALTSVLATAVLWRRGLELGDEGVISVGAWRILRGEVPHRDFFEIIPPLSLLAQAALFKVAGVSLAASRALAVLYATGLAAALGWLSSRLLSGSLWRALAIGTLVSCGVASWLLPSHHWLADVLALLALGAAARVTEAGCGGWAFAAGTAAGACALTLQDQGALLASGLLLWLGAAAGRGARVRALAPALAGMAAVAAPVAAWLLPRVPLATLIYDWVVFPLTRYAALPGNASAFAGAWREVAAAWGSAHPPLQSALLVLLTAKSVLVLLLPVAGAVLVAGTLLGGRGEERREAGLLFVALVAFYLPALRRPGLVNFQWALPAGILAFAWGAERLAREGGPRRRRVVRSIAAFSLLLFLGAGLAALPSAWVGGGGFVRSRAGTAGPLPGRRARALQGLLDAIEANAKPGEPVFCAGYLPMVNILAQRPNPAPLDVFVPPRYTTPEQVEAVIASLEKARVRWVVRPSGLSGGARWDGYLADRFRPVYGDGRYELWEREE